MHFHLHSQIVSCRCAGIVFAVSLAAHGQASNYVQDQAIVYAQFARAAFCSKSSLESWSCGDMCEGTKVSPSRVQFIEPGESWQVQAFVAKMSDNCVLSFRGSLTARNWLADAQAIPEAWPPAERNDWCDGCKIHRGFAVAYEELRNHVHAAINSLNCRRVAVTGHSLGAAVANIAAADIMASAQTLGSVRVGPVYTFGAPRVGNPAFVKAFQMLADASSLSPAQWRVVHYHDPVPRLPPRARKYNFLDYQHGPEEVYYTDEASSAYEVCRSTPDHIENPNCSLATSVVHCINFDHLNYFNLSFAHRNMNPACTGNKSASAEDEDAKLLEALTERARADETEPSELVV